MDNGITKAELKMALAIFRALTPENRDCMLEIARKIQSAQASSAQDQQRGGTVGHE